MRFHTRDHQRLSNVLRPRDFYKHPIPWRERWLQHYVEHPHVLRPGLSIHVARSTFTIIAVYGDYLWLRSGWRPFALTKRNFLKYFYESTSSYYGVIYLTQGEVDEMAFGKPYLDRGDPDGIWQAHWAASIKASAAEADGDDVDDSSCPYYDEDPRSATWYASRARESRDEAYLSTHE